MKKPARLEYIEKRGHCIVAAIAVLVVIAGFAASFTEKQPSGAVSFATVDTTFGTATGGAIKDGESGCIEEWFCTEWSSCKPNRTQARDCLDFNNCGTELSKPSEEGECDLVPFEGITGAAITIPVTGSQEGKTDYFRIAVYAMAVLCSLMVLFYIFLAYGIKKPLHHSWLAVAYWIVMAALPMSVYYSVTRNEHLVVSYIALVMSAIALILLFVVKPWIPVSPVGEVRHIDKILRRRSMETGERIERIRKSRADRIKEMMEFNSEMQKMDRKRELALEGVREMDLSKVDEKIDRLTGKGRETARNLMYIEKSVKDMENKFRTMNIRLSRWAEERRRQRKAAKERIGRQQK